MLSLVGIKRIYSSGKNSLTALDINNIDIEQGEFVSIVGPSGSGKSTLLNIIGLVDSPTEGDVLFNGDNLINKNISEASKFKRDVIGYVFQGFNLIQHLTAIENVMLPMIPYKKRKDIKKSAEELLDMVGLKNRKNHFPYELSGGEQQRVAIARALINNPKIIIGDEPTGNLDTKNRDLIIDVLKEINSQGITIIIATHDMEVANQTHRIIKLRDGKLVREEVTSYV